jgi:hypothetical protein
VKPGESLLKQVVVAVLLLIITNGWSSADSGHGLGSDTKIEIGEAGRLELLQKARSMPIGSSHEAVRAKLGKPDVERDLFSKDRRFQARVLCYYSHREGNGVNEKLDRYISFYFDQSGKLKSVGYKLSEEPESER